MNAHMSLPRRRWKTNETGYGNLPARATLGAEPPDNPQANNVGGLIFMPHARSCVVASGWLSRLTRPKDTKGSREGTDHCSEKRQHRKYNSTPKKMLTKKNTCGASIASSLLTEYQL